MDKNGRKQENTEQVGSLVVKFLPSLPRLGQLRRYKYTFQEIPFAAVSNKKNKNAGMYFFFFRQIPCLR